MGGYKKVRSKTSKDKKDKRLKEKMETNAGKSIKIRKNLPTSESFFDLLASTRVLLIDF